MAGLTPEAIAELLSNSRVKGVYDDKLVEFLASDDAAVNPADTWPEFLGTKNASTMYQGFNNAAKKMNGEAKCVRILQRDGKVFLINMDKVAVTTPVE